MFLPLKSLEQGGGWVEGPKKKANWAKSLTDALNLGLSMVAAVSLGYLGGHWLDVRYDTGMMLTIIGLLLGVATGFKMIWDRTGKKSR